MFDFFRDPLLMIYSIPGILIGLALHEFGHAFMADRLGDPTPRSQGRLTLDPRSHIDVFGFIMLVIVGFGWGKPVMTNSRHFKDPRRDEILVSVAGPMMNLFLAIAFGILIKIMYLLNIGPSTNLSAVVISLLGVSMSMNVLLFVLNLIPFPCFDGYHILGNIFSLRHEFFYKLEQYSMIIFVLLAVTGILSKIISPPIVYTNVFLSRILGI